MDLKTKMGQKHHKPEEAVIELMFNYMILMEYSLLDLQHSVRGFVNRMSQSVTDLDKIVTIETQLANEMNQRIATRLKNSTAVNQAMPLDPSGIQDLLALLARFGSLGDKLSPSIYNIIECLSFEDIQSQRIDHLTQCFKLLNQGIMQRLDAGLQNFSVEDIVVFAETIRKATRAMYTMPEERDIFDQVFPTNPPKAV